MSRSDSSSRIPFGQRLKPLSVDSLSKAVLPNAFFASTRPSTIANTSSLLRFTKSAGLWWSRPSLSCEPGFPPRTRLSTLSQVMQHTLPLYPFHSVFSLWPLRSHKKPAKVPVTSIERSPHGIMTPRDNEWPAPVGKKTQEHSAYVRHTALELVDG